MIKAPGFLKQNFAAPVLAGLMVLAPIGGKLGNILGGTTAHAQDSAEAATLPPDFNKVPTSIPQDRGSYKNEAWMRAGEFAKANPAVGIAVYGRPVDGNSEQIAKMIQGYFAKNGIKSEYFLSDEDKIGFNVGLYLKDVQFGPDDLKGTIQNIKIVIQSFPEAWPNYQASVPSTQPS